MIASNVKRIILVGHPVDQRVAELGFRNECAAGRAGEHEDVEPTGMVADQQAVRRNRAALGSDASATDPCRRAQKTPRPVRAPEQRFRKDVKRNACREQQQ